MVLAVIGLRGKTAHIKRNPPKAAKLALRISFFHMGGPVSYVLLGLAIGIVAGAAAAPHRAKRRLHCLKAIAGNGL